MVVSAVIHVGYSLALMNSYRLGAYNQAYPIARGTSPLLVAVGAYFLANEHLSGLPLAGVVILAAGLMSLALSSGRLAKADLPAVGAAVLTGLTIASYTVVDGLGVRHAHNPYGYAGLLFLLEGPAFPLIASSGGPRADGGTGPRRGAACLLGRCPLSRMAQCCGRRRGRRSPRLPRSGKPVSSSRPSSE